MSALPLIEREAVVHLEKETLEMPALLTNEMWFDRPTIKRQYMCWRHSLSPLRSRANAREVMATILWEEKRILLTGYRKYSRKLTRCWYVNVLRTLHALVAEKN